MKFSIIIPAHNVEGTIKACLDAVYSSLNKHFEVIVVDDKSDDGTANLAKKYPVKLIALNKKKGVAFARNVGKDASCGEILTFVDSDVVIKKDSLDIIEKSFNENKDIIGVTGILSKENIFANFFSRYKNLYMHFIFKRCPRFVDFLYGSIIAIRKDSFLKFNENFRITDDTELGQRYKKLNKKIMLNPALEVKHLKKYNFKTIIKNDFYVPFWWTKSFILHNGIKDVFQKGRFSHARLDQIASIGVAFLIMMSAIFFKNPPMRLAFFTFISIFLILNFKFFLFLQKEKGVLFLVKAVFFTYFDMLVMGLGVVTGILKHFIFV